MKKKKSELKAGIDYIGVTTAMFCHDGKGNFLLNRRSNKCRDEHGKWDAWGGKVEFGETFDEAARRELIEECGAKIVKIEWAGINQAHRIDQDGLKTHWVVIVFLVEIDPTTVSNREPEKFTELTWFKRGEWPAEVHSMFKADFEMAEKLLV